MQRISALYNDNMVIHQEDVTILKVNAPNNRTSQYMKQKLKGLKGEIDKSQ